jgi:hypothetical protein
VKKTDRFFYQTRSEVGSQIPLGIYFVWMERKLGTVTAAEKSAAILLEENKYYIGIRGIRL